MLSFLWMCLWLPGRPRTSPSFTQSKRPILNSAWLQPSTHRCGWLQQFSPEISTRFRLHPPIRVTVFPHPFCKPKTTSQQNQHPIKHFFALHELLPGLCSVPSSSWLSARSRASSPCWPRSPHSASHWGRGSAAARPWDRWAASCSCCYWAL